MQILSVALTNFKTHKEQQFDFQLGTNAICGENGAGKTSILEAIAWVLFNYQGSYKKEDLIRNGASSAQVRVVFISSRDSRTYEVQRSTTHGYTLYDPQLAEKLPYTRIKDEVLPWLRQNLGVAPGTDLGQLFANTIGVPQGTFTADFLLSTEKRKPIFDIILKVEEYQETYRQSNGLRRYAESQVQRLKDLIEQYEDSLKSWDELKNRQQQLQSEITQGESYLERLEVKRTALFEQRQQLIDQAEEIQQLRQQQQQLNNQIKSQEQTQERIVSSLTQAQQSANICQEQQSTYEAFIAIEQQIEKLTEEGKARQQLDQQQHTIEQSLSQSQQELSRLEVKLEQFSAAREELASLAAVISAQSKLEAQRDTLQQQQQKFASVRLQCKALKQQQENILREVAEVESEIGRLNRLKEKQGDIEQWEQQLTRTREQLSRLTAAQQFEQEIRTMLDRGKSSQDEYRHQVAAALKTLDSWAQHIDELSVEAIAPVKDALFQGGLLSKGTLDRIKSILNDLTQQTDKRQLEKQSKTLQSWITQAYKQRAELVSLPTQESKRVQLSARQEQIAQQLSQLTQLLTTEETIGCSLTQVEEQLRRLDNPKGKQQLIERNLERQDAVDQQYKTLNATRVAQVQQLETVTAKLKAFARLDEQLQAQQQLRQTHQAGYLLYLQNQQAAQQAASLQLESEALALACQQSQSQKAQVDKQLAVLTKDFDPNAFTIVDKQYMDVNSQADRLRGSLPQLKQRLIELTGQIDRLKATAEKRDQAQKEIKERDRLKRFINYARKVYKEAGPRITERYVQSISREADRLFRELLGRTNVALAWSADYEITVQEGAHTRRFINLSGGEQMCAALAVRLALLKVLADIDVAFFDEPTTNMDRARRASLAEAITRIKSFKQLFVISHDDTFEHVTETVITVERDPD
ncbi:RecF/RecN/SMC N terminal domain, putative [Synechococcus sp. PCC 7335]|uniref:AAA family ATPase n=1 Tax=Synechococcus sp. (strain ATCC 29403 / PCC 7335) TaxID=91464 RepID=UPI00017EBC39|nr:SMC family ATPase [Synechococcus sp. PCC 7335]EDX85155.1 RecF/RecN/SMC N terminal domain, putative [Synechococcus sp. PCC 7335]